MRLLVGNADVSLISDWQDIDNYAGRFIYLSDQEVAFNLLGQSFKTFSVRKFKKYVFFILF